MDAETKAYYRQELKLMAEMTRGERARFRTLMRLERAAYPKRCVIAFPPTCQGDLTRVAVTTTNGVATFDAIVGDGAVVVFDQGRWLQLPCGKRHGLHPTTEKFLSRVTGFVRTPSNGGAK